MESSSRHAKSTRSMQVTSRRSSSLLFRPPQKARKGRALPVRPEVVARVARLGLQPCDGCHWTSFQLLEVPLLKGPWTVTAGRPLGPASVLKSMAPPRGVGPLARESTGSGPCWTKLDRRTTQVEGKFWCRVRQAVRIGAISSHACLYPGCQLLACFHLWTRRATGSARCVPALVPAVPRYVSRHAWM